MTDAVVDQVQQGALDAMADFDTAFGRLAGDEVEGLLAGCNERVSALRERLLGERDNKQIINAGSKIGATLAEAVRDLLPFAARSVEARGAPLQAVVRRLVFLDKVLRVAVAGDAAAPAQAPERLEADPAPTLLGRVAGIVGKRAKPKPPSASVPAPTPAPAPVPAPAPEPIEPEPIELEPIEPEPIEPDAALLPILEPIEGKPSVVLGPHNEVPPDELPSLRRASMPTVGFPFQPGAPNPAPARGSPTAEATSKAPSTLGFRSPSAATSVMVRAGGVLQASGEPPPMGPFLGEEQVTLSFAAFGPGDNMLASTHPVTLPISLYRSDDEVATTRSVTQPISLHRLDDKATTSLHRDELTDSADIVRLAVLETLLAAYRSFDAAPGGGDPALRGHLEAIATALRTRVAPTEAELFDMLVHFLEDLGGPAATSGAAKDVLLSALDVTLAEISALARRRIDTKAST